MNKKWKNCDEKFAYCLWNKNYGTCSNTCFVHDRFIFMGSDLIFVTFLQYKIYFFYKKIKKKIFFFKWQRNLRLKIYLESQLFGNSLFPSMESTT